MDDDLLALLERMATRPDATRTRSVGTPRVDFAKHVPKPTRTIGPARRDVLPLPRGEAEELNPERAGRNFLRFAHEMGPTGAAEQAFTAGGDLSRARQQRNPGKAFAALAAGALAVGVPEGALPAKIAQRLGGRAERVVAASIRLPDGRIVFAPSHPAALEEMGFGGWGGVPLDLKMGADEGFLTSTGRHISRDEADIMVNGPDIDAPRLRTESAGGATAHGYRGRTSGVLKLGAM